jgi:hypothetical protein
LKALLLLKANAATDFCFLLRATLTISLLDSLLCSNNWWNSRQIRGLDR